VREDVPDGTVIATVHATDLDSGVKKHGGSGESPSAIVSNYLAYFIVEGNKKGHFKVSVLFFRDLTSKSICLQRFY
jgi:fructose-1,6-bisphosphatase/sedoheptulose 1,7-bisphosphatase-like protein